MSTTTQPNYRYGVRGVMIAKRLGAGTYDTPWHESGAESIEESAPTTNSSTWYSDDGNPATVNGASGNETINVTFSEFSDKFNTDILGHTIDPVTGMAMRSPDDEGSMFACGWEVQGTQKKTRIWKTGCTTTEPAASAFTTNGENVTESPESCTFTVNGDVFGGAAYDEFVCHEGDPGFDTFLDAVPVPGSTVDDATLSALTIGGATLSPAFSPDVSTYTATTSTSTGAITATATSDGATVSIKNGNTAVASGGDATWSEGQNVVTVIVTDGGATKSYVVVVTYSE